MTDPLLESYEIRPYRHGAVPFTDPRRIAAIARLLGHRRMPVETARVLELGCGEGMNLLPLAERFPDGRFVGVDFSPRQIATAESARSAAGLDNATLICRDLREYEPEAEGFDYVIAHGVYSWVPDEVKERLLQVCRTALVPGGIAYISYNVNPGSGFVRSLCDSVRAHLSADRASESKPDLPRLLAALEQAFNASPPSPFIQVTKEAIAEMRAKPEALLLHDELAEQNDPVAFLDFVAHAHRHGLEYLAEAHFAEMPWEHLPAGARAPLDSLRLDFLQQQGLLDLLGFRRFRSSLLAAGESIQRSPPDPAAIRDCAIGFRMWPAEGQIDLAPGVALRLVGSNGFQMGVEKPTQKAYFAALCEAAPGRISFNAAIHRAQDLAKLAGVTDTIEEDLLAKGVLRLFTVDQCDLLLSSGSSAINASSESTPSRLIRHQAANHLPVVNRWHETVELTPDQRRFLAGEAALIDEEALRASGLLF